MHRISVLIVLVLLTSSWSSQDATEAIQSRIETTKAGERILIQEVLIDAPIAAVWAAHTTDAGWSVWSSPKVDIDLRVGGTILTHYDTKAQIGDAGTNTLHIVNYVPERVLTLRADLSDNWPELMKQDADKLSNVIIFDELNADRTRVTSYGIGYRDTPGYDSVMQFFIQANEGLYRKLKQILESAHTKNK
ncbi:MAG: hypothetical protein ACI841_004645 [Planctomycetota bacterium]|jgi:uncharacterized protein YndB with AHSA1/START domain